MDRSGDQAVYRISGDGKVTLTRLAARARLYANSSMVSFRFWLILPVTVNGLCQIQSSVAFLKWIGAASISSTPSSSPTSWSRNENRRSSPSVMTSSPIPSCIAIA